MLQLAGGVTAVQLKVVPELVVAESDNPVGALGAAEQLEHVPTRDHRAGTSAGSHVGSEVWAWMHLYSLPL
jgi:hypothetical protein